MSLRALAVVFLASLLVGAARADEAFIPNQSSGDLTIVDLGAMTPGARGTCCTGAGRRVRDMAIPSDAISKTNSGGGFRRKPNILASALIR